MTPPSTDHQDSGNTEAKGAEAIYNRVKAAKKVPLDRMPYNLQYTVEVKNGSLIIPHYDHYHNIKFEWFDANERPHSDNGFGNASDHVQRNKNGQADTNQTEKPNEEKPQTEKPEEETPREEKPQSEKPESPKPTEEPEEESPEESEEPQVETEKVEEKLREAEDLLGKIQDPIIKSNAKETLTGLKNNLLFGTQDNNTIMAEAEKLLALLKESK
ncbi:streptococcal histidine triad protein PhpA [Streptococcus pneumoniae]